MCLPDSLWIIALSNLLRSMAQKVYLSSSCSYYGWRLENGTQKLEHHNAICCSITTCLLQVLHHFLLLPIKGSSNFYIIELFSSPFQCSSTCGVSAVQKRKLRCVAAVSKVGMDSSICAAVYGQPPIMRKCQLDPCPGGKLDPFGWTLSVPLIECHVSIWKRLGFL